MDTQLSPKQAREYLGITRSNFDKNYRPRLDEIRRGPRVVLFRVEDLDRMRDHTSFEGGRIVIRKRTVNDALDHAWKLQWSRCKSPDKKENLVRQVRKEIGHIQLKKLSYRHLEDWLFDLRERDKSPGTIKSRFYVLTTALNLAVRKEWIPEVPLSPELEAIGDGRERYLTPSEEIKILNSASCLSERDAYVMRNAIIFALDTGCRMGELIKVRGDSLTSDGVIFRKRKAGDKLALPLTTRAREAIHELLDYPYWVGLVQGARSSPTRAASAQCWITKRFTTIRNYAGMPDVCFHTCRHTCISRLVQRGVGMYIVKDFAGHASIKTTEKYAHLAPTSLASARNVLENIHQESNVIPFIKD